MDERDTEVVLDEIGYRLENEDLTSDDLTAIEGQLDKAMRTMRVSHTDSQGTCVLENICH